MGRPADCEHYGCGRHRRPDEIETITHEADIGGKDYVLAQVRALVRDSALPALTLVPDTGEVTIPTDGGTVTYTIVPAVVPSSELTVNLASSDVDVVRSSLTFTVGTSGNWETPQTVTVTSVADDDEFDDQAEIEHTAVLHGITYRWGSVFVTETDGNRAPYFEEGLDTTREVPESASQGTDVGAPVTALDLNTSDTLTYTLDNPSGNFAITLSNSTTGQITVAATDPPIDHPFDYEAESDYEVKVTATDPGGLTDTIEVKVRVNDVNEPPVITGEAAPTFEENRTGRIGRYRATDPEGKPFSWAVSESEPRNFSIDGNGYLSFSVPPDFEDKSSYYVSIVAADDKLLPGYLDVTVAIVDIDEPPTITGNDTLTFAENTETTTTLHTYRASDPERVTTTFTWSLGGTDSGDFNISNQGELTFRNTPNYERPADSGGNNEYNITVRASDGSLTGTKDVTVTVTDVNEAPTTPTGRDGISVAENTSGNLSRYSSSDPERATIEWSVTGTDANDFRIDSSGNLAFDGAPDYEVPTDTGGNHEYNIRVDAKDSSLTSSLDVTVTVTPIDEPPVITGRTTFNDWQENDDSMIETYTAVDPEDDTPITWSLVGADRSDFTITNGVLAFASTPDYERPTDSGGDNHYNVTVQATDSNNKRGEQDIDVIVENVDEPPVVEGPDTDDFPENASTSRQVGRYTATHPEERHGNAVAHFGRHQRLYPSQQRRLDIQQLA